MNLLSARAVGEALKAEAKLKKSVFRVTGLKISGRVGTHIFFNYFFWKKYYFMHFERRNAFQNA